MSRKKRQALIASLMVHGAGTGRQLADWIDAHGDD